jgi:hypothetical protein
VPLAEKDSLSDFPFRFNIGMGVRRRDRALRDSLQVVLERKRPEIEAILKEYNVPVFPIVTSPGDDDGPQQTGELPRPAADTGRAAAR